MIVQNSLKNNKCRKNRLTMANMPWEHKLRIISTISAVHSKIDGASPIEKSCHFLAMMGAAILENCYGIPAEVVPGRALYKFAPQGDEPGTVLAFDDRASENQEPSDGIGHSIVLAAGGGHEDDTPFIVDFQS
ncbi:MAG: DUF2026 family protein, partial [Deltaproteobacteria bacterium]|nr:DUF2026 family protein [Deltaproteobacteria bacterium]